MIPKETIDRILDSARIDEVVSDFLPLRKRGVNLLGLCPFHNEKTPSFTVSPSKGIYKCFGCGESGTSVNFIMKHENLTYPEALKYLASKYGIEVQEEKQTSEELRRQAEHESLMAITAFAQSHFKNRLLASEEGRAVGLQYFYERGINDYLIEKFQLGYSSEQWDDLHQAAIAKGYTNEQLIKVGLLVETDDKKVYDRFRGRVIFPIHNITGRPIGFGGRILDSSKSKAKYVNSPESEIYHKSDVLYGLHLARTPIVKAENCYLVEGYTDVISLHSAGIENVVASSGTSLTTGQIKLLKRYTSMITILYDGDAAGLKAAFRGIDMIIEEGLSVRIVLFPDGEDPDSFARKNPAEIVAQFLEKNAKDFILFKSDLLSAEAGNDPVKKSALIRDIVETISLIPENINRLLYTRQAADILNLGEQLLIDEVNKFRRKKYLKITQDQAFADSQPTPLAAPKQLVEVDYRRIYELEILRVLLNYGNLQISPAITPMRNLVSTNPDDSFSVGFFIVMGLLSDDIQLESDEQMNQLFSEFREAVEQNTMPTNQYFTHHPDEMLRNLAIDLLTEPYELHSWNNDKIGIEVKLETDPQILASTVISSVFRLKSKIVSSMADELAEKLKTIDNQDEIMEVQQKIVNLRAIRNKIDRERGIVISQ